MATWYNLFIKRCPKMSSHTCCSQCYRRYRLQDLVNFEQSSQTCSAPRDSDFLQTGLGDSWRLGIFFKQDSEIAEHSAFFPLSSSSYQRVTRVRICHTVIWYWKSKHLEYIKTNNILIPELQGNTKILSLKF